MAIDLGSQALSVTQQERTWRIECFCEDGTDYTLVAHRETIATDSNGVPVFSVRGKTVTRSLSQVINQPDALQFLGLAKSLCDAWAAEDAAAAPNSPIP